MASIGKMGLIVVMIAIVGTVAGAYIISMDVETREVTRYSELSDITGWFSTEATPDYTEYNPSTNYTGYYTANPKYFDPNAVDFATSSPNNYRLPLSPLVDTMESFLLDHDVDGSISAHILYWTDNYNFQSRIPRAVSVDRILTGSADMYTLISDIDSYETGGFFFFLTGSQVSSNNILMRNPAITGELEYYDTPGGPSIQMPADTIPVPVLAISYDKTTRQVSTYYDREMTQPGGISAPSELYLVWSPSAAWFGNSGRLSTLDLPSPVYMDPSKGVELK